MCVASAGICPLWSYWFVTLFFFFFKQKTAYEMRISDWSSDVCSSDLHVLGQGADEQPTVGVQVLLSGPGPGLGGFGRPVGWLGLGLGDQPRQERGAPADRKSVV